MNTCAGARVIDWIDDGEQLCGPIAVSQQRKRQDRPHGRMRGLTAVLAEAGRISFDIAGVVWGVVEGRREQLHQAVAAADQLRVDRRHRADRALAVRTPGDHGPRLSDGIYPTLIAGDRSQGRTVIEVAAPIPVAVPGLTLDGLCQSEGVLR